jgi:Zn-dependent protease
MLQHMFDPKVILVTWPVLLFSLSLHEFLHAWMADRLGDPTARYSGRLTINPIAHYDPIGTTMALLFGLGWAKPVPVNASIFRWPKRDMMLTALGGPVMNFALAFCFGVAFKLLQLDAFKPDALGSAAPTVEIIERMAVYGVFINILLGLFNLIPLFPLDGHHILRRFLSFHAAVAYDRFKHYGSYILMALIVIGSPLSVVIGEPMQFIIRLALTDAELFRFWTIMNKLSRGF